MNILMESSIMFYLFSSLTLCPFQSSSSLAFLIFPQALTSLHTYTEKTSWWKAWLCFVFSVLLPFIPSKPLAPWHSRFFAQSLISLHSYIEKTFWWKAKLCSFFSQEKTKTHNPTQSYQLPKPPHCKYGAWDLC